MYGKARTGVRKISTVACGFSPIKIHYSDYQKCFINRINYVYVYFNKILLQCLLWNVVTICFDRCNHTCYCVGMVSVTSASRYQSRPSLYIRV